MKKRRRKITALLLIFLLLLSGCASSTQVPEGQEQAPSSQEEKIKSLEAELESFKQKELDYQSKISALETRVAQLTASTTTPEHLTESVTFHYREENGGAVITGYGGNVALLTIPPTLDGLPVIAIGERAFERSSLTAVILPESVTAIGWFAFYECENLAGVTLPASICEIGYAVFDGCSAITLHCPAGSYAERYAQSYGIPYTAI